MKIYPPPPTPPTQPPHRKIKKKRMYNHMALEADLISEACVISQSLSFFNPKIEIT